MCKRVRRREETGKLSAAASAGEKARRDREEGRKVYFLFFHSSLRGVSERKVFFCQKAKVQHTTKRTHCRVFCQSQSADVMVECSAEKESWF